MSDPRLPRIRDYEVLQPYHINAPNAELDRQRLVVGMNSTLGKNDGPGGTLLWAVDYPEFWARITGGGGGGENDSSGPYAWIELIERPGGEWEDGYQSGTVEEGAAYEVTGNGDVPDGKVVRLRYSDVGRVWLFQFSACP